MKKKVFLEMRALLMCFFHVLKVKSKGCDMKNSNFGYNILKSNYILVHEVDLNTTPR